jgi:hypothetical protein
VRGEPGVAGAAGEDLHAAHAAQHRVGILAEQPGTNAPASTTASMVSAIARGCSKISFCMKCRYGPSSSEASDTSDTCTSRTASRSVASNTRTPARVSSAVSPSSRKITRRVAEMIADTSEATKFSPSPNPTSSGQPMRAQASRSGRDLLNTASA